MLGLGLMLMLRQLFVWLMLLHQLKLSSGHARDEPVYEMPERCKYLKQSREMMHQRCKGKFPLVAYTKFRDTFMKQTDRMALFMPESLDYVMVALKESQLHDCQIIQLIEVNEYICFDWDGGKYTVRLKSARMYCFPFHIQLTDDLMHECILERDGVSESTLEKNVLRTKRGIIHYTFDNDAAVKHPLPRRNIIFLIILELLVLLDF